MNRIVPLAYLAPGERGRVIEVIGGRGLMTKLYEMGIYPSSVVEVVVSHPFGPVLVEVNGSRIAIGRGMAMKVMVERV